MPHDEQQVTEIPISAANIIQTVDACCRACSMEVMSAFQQNNPKRTD